MEVKQSVRLPAPVTEVWKTIGGFNALPDWHPMVKKSELAKGGQERKLTLPGGATIVEKLESKDDKSYRYSYSITDSPLPVADYHSTIEVRQDKLHREGAPAIFAFSPQSQKRVFIDNLSLSANE